MTLVEAFRYGDIKHTQLFLKLQKVVLHKRRNIPGNSHLIIRGNKSHQQDKRREKSSAFEQQKSQKMYLLTAETQNVIPLKHKSELFIYSSDKVIPKSL